MWTYIIINISIYMIDFLTQNPMLKKIINFAIKPELFFQNSSEKIVSKLPYFYFAACLYLLGLIWIQFQSWSLRLWTGGLLWSIITLISYFSAASLFYSLRIKLSWWEYNLELSANIIVYSEIYLNILLAILLFYFIPQFIIENPDNFIWVHIDIELHTFIYILLLLFSYHSIYLSYRTVSKLTNVKKFRSIILFIILPVIFSTVVLLWSTISQPNF